MEWDKERKKLTKVYNYVLTLKKELSLVLNFQVGHQIIMEDQLVKINNTKQNLKIILASYEDDRF